MGDPPRGSGRSKVSSASSEAEGRTCQANSLHMALPRKITRFRQSPCGDIKCDITPILREDYTSYSFPANSLSDGANLRRTHREIYQTLTSNQVWAVIHFVKLVASGPEGGLYCITHMSRASIPGAQMEILAGRQTS